MLEHYEKFEFVLKVDQRMSIFSDVKELPYYNPATFSHRYYENKDLDILMEVRRTLERHLPHNLKEFKDLYKDRLPILENPVEFLADLKSIENAQK